MSSTDTNQASEDELYERIEKLFDLRISSSGADIGIGFKTSRERSGSDRTWVDYEEWLELRQSIESLIRTEKLKLLAEVRERVVGEDEKLVIPDYPKTDDEGEPLYSKRAAKEGRKQVTARYHTRKELRNDQRTELTKLEAEL